jgi:phenylpropionate dioxygenase-like ring-hydroxylating dioxygenase large terminal subunit
MAEKPNGHEREYDDSVTPFTGKDASDVRSESPDPVDHDAQAATQQDLSSKRRTGLAFGPTYEQAAIGLPNYWYPVMFSVQLGKRPKPYTLLGQNLMFVRRQNKAYALENRCPHRGIPLHQGKFEFEGTISCVYHGWTFDLATGQMIAALPDGPDSPMPYRSVCSVRAYPVEERAGVVWVWMGETAPMVPVEDDIPEELLRDDVVMMGWIHPRYGNWRFGVENAIDEGHARYLHKDSIQGRWRQSPAWTDVKIVETPDKKWIYRRVDWSQTYAYYPGLGVWPKKHFWRKEREKDKRTMKARAKHAIGNIPESSRPGSTRLPSTFRPVGWPYPMVVSYEFHVPIDKENELYHQYMVRFTRNPITKLIFKLKYMLWHRWVGEWRFNSQDGSMVASMTSNMKTERLMKTDASITGWRKMVERQARGQVDEWRSIGVEHTADLDLAFKGAAVVAADPSLDQSDLGS